MNALTNALAAIAVGGGGFAFVVGMWGLGIIIDWAGRALGLWKGRP